MSNPIFVRLSMLAAMTAALSAPAAAQVILQPSSPATTANDMLHNNPNGPDWLQKYDRAPMMTRGDMMPMMMMEGGTMHNHNATRNGMRCMQKSPNPKV
jgi:hypothetical protein